MSAKREWARLAKLREKAGTPEVLAGKIRRILLGMRSMSLAELCSKLDRGTKQVEAAILLLESQGFNAKISEEGHAEIRRQLPVGGDFRISGRLIHGRKIRFGAIGDTHLGSKYERLDVLNALYDWFAKQGVTRVYHSGNLVDGRGKVNRFDLLPGCDSMEGQLAYAAKHYPQRKGIETHFIAGDDHEGWWVQDVGVNIGEKIQQAAEDAGRKDLKYLSYMEADLRFPAPQGETWVKVVHPGGGSAYATSYTAQKIVESFQGGEKPAVLLIGHYHKMEYGRPREVLCLQTGCTQDQTPFMRKKRLEAHLGGWIVELEQAPNGHVACCTLSDRRFYDRGFYEGKEKFARW